jgi:hypothetical protein
MPENMGKSYDESMLKSPLTVGRPGREPGPEVNNNPVAMPSDPMKFIPGNSKKAGRKSGL